jgi:hypothetical protein
MPIPQTPSVCLIHLDYRGAIGLDIFHRYSITAGRRVERISPT